MGELGKFSEKEHMEIIKLMQRTTNYNLLCWKRIL